jgi:hypothetical protein
MSLPEFTETGDLPLGVHAATLTEVQALFGSQEERREAVTRDLTHIHALALRTGCLSRFILFGSYITTKPYPNDVDIILVMTDDFQLAHCPPEAIALFDHAVAQARYGASIFWVRPSLVIGESVDEFIAHWQIKRDGSHRGIVEIVPENE